MLSALHLFVTSVCLHLLSFLSSSSPCYILASDSHTGTGPPHYQSLQQHKNDNALHGIYLLNLESDMKQSENGDFLEIDKASGKFTLVDHCLIITPCFVFHAC